MQKAQAFTCGGLNTIQSYFSARNISLQPYFLIGLYGLLVTVFCLFYMKASHGPPSLLYDNVFLFSFLLYILSELFIVGHRGGYNQIEWVFAVLLILQQKKMQVFVLVVVFLAIVLENVKFNRIPHQFELAEIILLSVLLYVVMGGSYINKAKVFFMPSKVK